MTTVTELPQDTTSETDEFEIGHLMCGFCDPDHALCGDDRNGHPIVDEFGPNTPLCVVCEELDKTHVCKDGT